MLLERAFSYSEQILDPPVRLDTTKRLSKELTVIKKAFAVVASGRGPAFEFMTENLAQRTRESQGKNQAILMATRKSWFRDCYFEVNRVVTLDDTTKTIDVSHYNKSNGKVELRNLWTLKKQTNGDWKLASPPDANAIATLAATAQANPSQDSRTLPFTVPLGIQWPEHYSAANGEGWKVEVEQEEQTLKPKTTAYPPPPPKERSSEIVVRLAFHLGVEGQGYRVSLNSGGAGVYNNRSELPLLVQLASALSGFGVPLETLFPKEDADRIRNKIRTTDGQRIFRVQRYVVNTSEIWLIQEQQTSFFLERATRNPEHPTFTIIPDDQKFVGWKWKELFEQWEQIVSPQSRIRIQGSWGSR